MMNFSLVSLFCTAVINEADNQVFGSPEIPTSAKSCFVMATISGSLEIGTQTSVMTDLQPGLKPRAA